MLQINGITKVLHEKPVLHDLSCEFAYGIINVIVGPSGVGKSTLLRTLAGLLTPDAGTITLDGVSLIGGQGVHKVGLVFQHFNLFNHLSVERNITLALEYVLKKNKQEARQIAYEFLAHYGLLDTCQLAIHELSGGQKQRLAIVRALVMCPKVICFDEPTSALDPMLTASVARTLQDLATQGYMVIVTTHAPHLLEQLTCNVHLMHQGTIVESATMQELRANNAAYPQLTAFFDSKS